MNADALYLTRTWYTPATEKSMGNPIGYTLSHIAPDGARLSESILTTAELSSVDRRFSLISDENLDTAYRRACGASDVQRRHAHAVAPDRTGWLPRRGDDARHAFAIGARVITADSDALAVSIGSDLPVGVSPQEGFDAAGALTALHTAANAYPMALLYFGETVATAMTQSRRAWWSLPEDTAADVFDDDHVPTVDGVMLYALFRVNALFPRYTEHLDDGEGRDLPQKYMTMPVILNIADTFKRRDQGTHIAPVLVRGVESQALTGAYPTAARVEVARAFAAMMQHECAVRDADWKARNAAIVAHADGIPTEIGASDNGLTPLEYLTCASVLGVDLFCDFLDPEGSSSVAQCLRALARGVAIAQLTVTEATSGYPNADQGSGAVIYGNIAAGMQYVNQKYGAAGTYGLPGGGKTQGLPQMLQALGQQASQVMQSPMQSVSQQLPSTFKKNVPPQTPPSSPPPPTPPQGP